ncbi:AAA family ATPase [Pararhizobium sp. DWP3-4]|uniref:AAA family ATPase n=1 Tax=Pararhizobium sp. DWP3-4 TaxID=2804565 RepID=UPI003CF13F0A
MKEFSLISRLGAKSEILEERQRRVTQFFERHAERATSYVASLELRAAVDVALSLGRPLLLTGEPGSGKTLAAYWLKLQLDLPDSHFLEYQVRSDSRARDVCYNFDAVSWFRESQISKTAVDKWKHIEPRALGTAFGWPGESDGSKPYIVLIDEIDKAPRDFPNDLLRELDQMQFKIEETNTEIGPPALRPIIVITSNSERRLPDPFLRRCVTHHIEITPQTVLEILQARFKAYRGSKAAPRDDDDLVRAGAEFWTSLFELEGRFTRKPTIAEFWQWLILASEYPERDSVNLVSILKQKRGAEIEKLPRIKSLFLPSDLKVLSNA